MRLVSFLLAAGIAVTGATASFAPAQAATRALPAVTANLAGGEIVQVHGKPRYYTRRGEYRPRYKSRPRHYVKRRYYNPYAYYPRYRKVQPGFSIQFNFGTPGYRRW